jgi:DNA-binding transcriptional LysR family regulator
MLDATRLRVLVAVARNGSVTAAAHALNYAQPSISHHIARLEAETGAKLMERAGRGIRLTDAGRLLAERAEEILGRLDAAEAELAVHVGLRQGRVRLAAFGAALGTIVPAAAASLLGEKSGTDLTATQAEPDEALRLLRAGLADVALVFRYQQESTCADNPADPADPAGPAGPAGPADSAGSDPDSAHPDAEGLRARLVLDEPVYLITSRDTVAGASPLNLADYADRHWIAGCGEHRGFLIEQCAEAGFTPKISYTTDDYVAAQALVVAGLGVTMLPGLTLRAARHPRIVASPLPGLRHHVLAVTYGEPPDPPTSVRLIDALNRTASEGRLLTTDCGPARDNVHSAGFPRSAPMIVVVMCCSRNT